MARLPIMTLRKAGTLPQPTRVVIPPDGSDGASYFSGVYPPYTPSNEKGRENFISSFMWGVYGDACGMPFESQSPMDIYAHNNNQWVSGLTEPKNAHKKNLKLGGWTDDTQLKIAIMESILSEGDINMESIAEGHVRMLGLGPRGWGGSTRDSVMKLKAGVPWDKSGYHDEPEKGGGNGIPMKTGVIGAYYAAKYGDHLTSTGSWYLPTGLSVYTLIANSVRDIAIMTHLDSRPIIAGIVQAILVAWGVLDHPLDWERMMRMIQKLEDFFPNDGDTLSSRLIHIDLDRDLEYHAHIFRTGCYVLESYSFTIAAYLLYRNQSYPGETNFIPDDIPEWTHQVINCGGDCDSTASMFAELVGATQAGDSELWAPLEEVDRLKSLAAAFWDSSLRK